MRKQKFSTFCLFILLAFFLGVICGVVIWITLKIITLLTGVIWTTLPEVLGISGISQLFYNLIVCLLGAMPIAFILYKYGPLPETSEQVIEKLKKTGTYPYEKLKLIIISVILPLIFGATLGPEAGLVGVIVALCCWVNDVLKYKGGKLIKFLDQDKKRTLGEAGISAVFSLIFFTPFVGIANNLEQEKESKDQRKLDKKYRTLIYACCVLGGFLIFMALNALFDLIIGDTAFSYLVADTGLPRFDYTHEVTFQQWLWYPIIFVIALLLALIYQLTDKATGSLAKKITQKFQKPKKQKGIKFSGALILTASVAIILAVCGFFLPNTMFSGESQLHTLIANPELFATSELIITAILKIALVAFCINFGWRGGNIFPMMFASCALGIALASIINIDGSFVAAIMASAVFGFITRKPFTAFLLVFICFPWTYFVPMAITAFLAAKIPSPFEKGTAPALSLE